MVELNFSIDPKGRVSIKKLIPEGATMLKGYYDEEKEEIILKPYTEVPLSTWILSHPAKLERLKNSIDDVRKGRVVSASEVSKALGNIDEF